uniref:Uncharacterized protein n=1 Tax=Vespula pensylvanica TaxID=30213 RepID=A0A834JRW6_VESPE|nr:hypothetical protein H0235_017583 [Vespula pensylvanica]
MVIRSMLCLWNGFMMSTRVFLLISGTLNLLTLAILKNFALHIVRYLLYQIVKTAEEAGAAHEFITNLPRDMKPKTLDCENSRVVQEAVGKSNKRMNIVSNCS